MPEDPDERSARLTRAAHIRWASMPNHVERSISARAALQRRYEHLADPHHRMTPDDRAEAARQLRNADMAAMRWRKHKLARQRREAQTND